MKASFREADGTDAHHRCLTQGLIHFRYKARTALDATLRELFTKFDYLAIPLHVIGAHWALAIVVNANRVADADWTPNQGPALIFLLDSLSVTGSATALTRAGQEISRWFRAVMKVMLGQTREPEAFRILQIPEVRLCLRALRSQLHAADQRLSRLPNSLITVIAPCMCTTIYGHSSQCQILSV